MDNRKDPVGATPPSQLGAPTEVKTDFDSNPQEGTPHNPNSGMMHRKPAPQPVRSFGHKITALWKLPSPVRNFVAKRPAASVGLALLAGLGVFVARKRVRHT